jgi:GNAT superfamily N-acetyltransferase
MPPSALASWIAGLMRENREALGFLPFESLDGQYLTHGRYVLQHDEAGRRVGYLLHGAPRLGRTLAVAQHCIADERRRHGYGEAALGVLLERAERAGASAVTVRCAAELESLAFWQQQGFVVRDVVPGGERRGRLIVRLWRPLTLPLLERLRRAEVAHG